MTFGEKIKSLRSAKNMSQPEFAALVGIEQSYLSKLENDKSVPSNEIFRSLLTALGLSLPALLNDPDIAEDKQRLQHIPDVEQWLKQSQHKQAKTQRLFLYISALLITLACCSFYAGSTKQLFSEALYRYESVGVIYEAESDDIFRNYRDLLDRNDDNYHVLWEQKRLEMETRKSVKLHTTYDYMGESFTLSVDGGRRVFRYDGNTEFPRKINAILQILGVGLFAMGILGFLLERRIESTGK